MKTTLKLLLAGILTTFCCSIGNAQNYTNSLNQATMIYSNSFNGGAVDISGTTPTYINPIATSYGASLTATFDVVTNKASNGFFAYQNGTLGAGADSILLPFTPVTGYVYTLSASLTFASIPTAGGWGAIGYGANMPLINGGRFNDTSVNGNPWTLLNYAAQGGGAELFPTRSGGTTSKPNLMNAVGVPYTINLVVDTTGAKWNCALIVAGTPVNNAAYAANPTIHSIGYGQTTTTAGAYNWNSLTLFASPMVLVTQPNSAAVAAGSIFTNTVVVAAANPVYQWYRDGLPLPIGGQTNLFNGATNASLIMNPVVPGDASTNYYVIITNSLGGSVTSAPVSLTVFTNPAIVSAFPAAYTNLITLYGGTNISGTAYAGSTPTFSVSVIGQAPFTYRWFTNGLAAGASSTFTNTTGTASSIFTFTNCQLNAPTNFAFVVTNSLGATTNTWAVSYIQTPTVPFIQSTMSNNPIGFWRLNEGPDDLNGDEGVLALDSAGGNNGIYTNVVLGYAGFTNNDPTEASARFNYFDAHSDVYGIQGIDFSNSASATFSVQAWANGSTLEPNGAPIIAKGYNGGEQFSLDVNGNKWRFLVRNGAGTAVSVTAATGPDNNWHFVVGVCDEVNGAISLYVDGLIVGSAAMTSGSGVFPCTTPISIGARGASAIDTDGVGFFGYLSDVGIYNRALSSGDVARMYPYPLTFAFVPPLPPTNYVYLSNGTISIPATVFGPAPMGYYWTNVTVGGILGSGKTNATGNLNATLVISNAPVTLSGDLFELVVTNAASSTNWFVTLFSPAPPTQLGYSSQILYSNYFNGGTWNEAGSALTAANLLVGGTNATWSDSLGTNDTGMLQANGTPTTGQSESWQLPFTPHVGYIYTLTATVTLPGYPGSWVGAGFAQGLVTNVTSGRYGDVPVSGWEIDTATSTDNLQAFMGGTTVANINFFYPPVPVTLTNTIILDTTLTNWGLAFYVNGVLASSNNYPSNPTIGSVGITQNSIGAPADVQWNTFALTQVAPVGVAPYILSALPPTSVTVGAGSPLSIPATAFSSFAPYGYNWSNTNTAAILASGTTNTVAPLLANLSVASVPSTWNGNTLALILTNAYGTNISLVSLIVTNATIIPTNKPVITGFAIVGGTNVVLTATNGQSGGTYYLLGTTNLLTPLSQWLPLMTNVILTNANGNGFLYVGTNVIHPSTPQQFYILSNTN